MRLQLQGVISTGVSLLDAGVTDIQATVVGGVLQIYASTGRYGGLAGYTLDANGTASVLTTVIYPPWMAMLIGDHLVFSPDSTEPMLLLGDNAQGLFGYRLGASGPLGFMQDSFAVLQAMATDGSFASIEGLILLSAQAPELFPLAFECTQVTDLVSVTLNGNSFILTACAQTDAVTAFRVDTTSGALVQVGTMGASQGLGIDNPTALQVAEIDGQTFVIVAAAGTGSLSVMLMRPDGTLVPTDHVLDNGTTRFDGVQDLAVAQSGDHVFVVAGGADNGLTLFLLLPDGRLVHLQTLADGANTSLHKVTAIEVVVQGDEMHVFVGSQNEGGLTHFTLDLSTLGPLQRGGANAEVLTGGAGDDILMAVGLGDTLLGGAGDDVLVTGRGGTAMTGGTGADTFVIGNDSGASAVLDFQRGVDRLDMTGLPMLRDVSQLTLVSTANGARIEYRGHVITLTAADGQPLTLADVFPGGLLGGDHYAYYPLDLPPPPPPGDTVYPVPPRAVPQDPTPPGIAPIPDPAPRTNPQPGSILTGNDTFNRLRGTDRDDTIQGNGGNDIIEGGLGHDVIHGGDGADEIRVTGGDNIIFGDTGNDRLYGAQGNESIEGGDGDDVIYGKDGNDTLIGGAGNDTIWGGDGDDVLFGISGNNILGCGAGNDYALGAGGVDRIYSGFGNDTIIGGGGSDGMGGGPGEDIMFGGDGHDRMFGRFDNDWMDGGNGSDEMWSGTGDDTVFGGAGNDRIYGVRGDDLLYGQAGNDAIWGGFGDDLVNGGDGNDWLSGEDGDDIIIGGAGTDTLRGGQGIDQYWGGDDADVFEFFSDHEVGWIMDFDPAEGDILRLDDAMWAALGPLSATEVVARFGSLDSRGNLVLDFTEHGGAVIILSEFSDTGGLIDSLSFM